jgi:hypothetical protein
MLIASFFEFFSIDIEPVNYLFFKVSLMDSSNKKKIDQ